MTPQSWFFGALIAFGLGYLCTELFQRYLHWVSDIPPIYRPRRLPPEVTGTFERLLAFLLVVLSVTNYHTILLAWLAAKAAANWARPEPPESNQQERYEYRSRSIMALMLGIVSIGFGVAGGYVAKHGLPQI